MTTVIDHPAPLFMHSIELMSRYEDGRAVVRQVCGEPQAWEGGRRIIIDDALPHTGAFSTNELPDNVRCRYILTEDDLASWRARRAGK